MKVSIDKVKAHVSLHLEIGGSVLEGSIQARVPRVETHFEIESAEDPDKVAAVLRNAKAGCYMRAALTEPVVIDDTTKLNGVDLRLHQLE